jgi:hypothetical protein
LFIAGDSVLVSNQKKLKTPSWNATLVRIVFSITNDGYYGLITNAIGNRLVQVLLKDLVHSKHGIINIIYILLIVFFLIN